MAQNTGKTKAPLFAVYGSPRMLMVLGMGFFSGLPFPLKSGTLQAWLHDAGVDITVIGLFSLVGLPYTLKFLWAPLLDRFLPPGLARLGRRRGWMLAFQGALTAVIALMAFVPLPQFLSVLACLCVLLSFFSASQDIVIDAYRGEILDRGQLAAGAASAIFGYRMALIVSGAGALLLAEYLPWRTVFFILSLLMLSGSVLTLFAPEPEVDHRAAKDLAAVIVDPLRELFRRRGVVEMFLFIVFFKLGNVCAAALTTPFLLDMGYSKGEIGAVGKGWGMVATLVGAFIGGEGVLRLGMRRSLVVFGVVEAVAILAFSVLTVVPHTSLALIAAIGLENICGGLGTAAFSACLMAMCAKRFTGSQYALLTSLSAITREIGPSATGFVVKAIGWGPFFVVCAALAIPGLVLVLLRFDRWEQGEEAVGDSVPAREGPHTTS